MAITVNKLRSSTFTTIYNTINSNVPDPSNRSKQWIFSSFPSLQKNFVKYPIIVIPNIDPIKDYALFDNTTPDVVLRFSIEMYHTDRAKLYTLTDSVDSVMNSKNFDQFSFTEFREKTGQTDLGAGKVHYKIITFTVDLINKGRYA